jgi:hypothetical protein
MDAIRNDPANQLGPRDWARAASDAALEYQLDNSWPGDESYEAAARELAQRAERWRLCWIKWSFWTTLVMGIGILAATLFA